MITSQMYCHKRGDTFGLAGPVKLPTGTWTAKAQMRDPLLGNTLVAEFDVVLEVEENVVDGVTYTHLISIGKAAVAAEDDPAPEQATSTWRPGPMAFDIQFTDGAGNIRSTKTAGIKVIQDITL